MPTVKQIDPIHTPEKFFLEDQEGDFSLINEKLTFAEGVSYRRKSEHGEQDLHVYDDCYKIYENEELVAEAQVILEVFELGEWQPVNFVKTSPEDLALSIKTQDIEKGSVSGDASLNIKFDWKGGENQSGKTVFYGSYPDKTIRIKWVITIHNSEHLVLDYSDYKGNNTFDDRGEVNRIIIFEPDGVKNELLIDPYLSVSEEATYIKVVCDGFIHRFYTNAVEYVTLTQNPANDTNWMRIYYMVIVSSVSYYINDDPNSTMEIIENSPTRVVIRLSGNFHDDGVPQDLANSTKATVLFTIYQDRWFQELEWVISGNITLDSTGGNRFGVILFNTSNVAGIYESGGSESAGYSGDLAHDYMGHTTDDYNIQMIHLDDSGQAGLRAYHNASQVHSEWNNVTLSADTYKITQVFIVDSAERDGSATIYDSTDRLSMGDQYKRTSPPTYSDGLSAITDLNIPDIVSSGLGTDGAYHGDIPADYQGKLEFNQIEIGPAVVIHDWALMSGSTPDEHLIAHLKCEQYYNTDYLRCEVEDGNTRFRVTGTPANCSFPSSVRGNGWLNEYNDGAVIEFTLATVGVDYQAGTVTFWYTPENTTPDETEYLWRFDAASDMIATRNTSNVLRFDYGGQTLNVNDPGFLVGQPIHLAFSWYDDGTNAYRFIIVNGQVVGTLIDTNRQGVFSTTGYVGAYSSAGNEGDGTYDDVKIYDACILPYGAFFTGYDQLGDYSKAHSDITFYWKADADAVSIGGVTATESDGSYVGSGIIGNCYDNENNTGNRAAFTVTSNNIIDGSQGALSFWFKIQTWTNDRALFGWGDADDSIQIIITTDDDIRFRYETQTVIENAQSSGLGLSTGEWHHCLARWDASNISIEIDGVEVAADTVANAWNGPSSGTMYFCAGATGTSPCDMLIDEAYITDNSYTPQIWTNFGKPLWMPLMKDES